MLFWSLFSTSSGSTAVTLGSMFRRQILDPYRQFFLKVRYVVRDADPYREQLGLSAICDVGMVGHHHGAEHYMSPKSTLPIPIARKVSMKNIAENCPRLSLFAMEALVSPYLVHPP